MADILLKYLTDLPAATEANNEDLMHINQGGNDKSITISSLILSMVNGVYPPGITIWFNSSSNPNDLFPGTLWARVPGAGRVVRIANSSGSDISETGGSNKVSITTSNLPAHNHEFSGQTETFDYGTKSTTTNGSHTHSLTAYHGEWKTDNGRISDGALGTSFTATTGASGSHSHQTNIGAHQHNFQGSTSDTGGGALLDVTNQYITQAAWYRVS